MIIGGTSVSSALNCPENEQRCIVSLDMGEMNQILWVDPKNMLARAQAGIIGIDLESKVLVLNAKTPEIILNNLAQRKKLHDRSRTGFGRVQYAGWLGCNPGVGNPEE